MVSRNVKKICCFKVFSFSFRSGSVRVDFHPPWHVHMYYAELIVSAIQHYFDLGANHSLLSVANYKLQSVAHTNEIIHLTKHKEMECNSQSPLVLHLSVNHLHDVGKLLCF